MHLTGRGSRPPLLPALTLLCLALSSAAFAKDNPSFTQVGHNISVDPNEQVSDLTCFGCSVRVRGQVAGNVTAFGGSFVIEGHGQVAGDVTSMGGRGWFVPMLLAPFVIVGLLVAFVIWLIQRVCQPSIPAAAA